MVLKPPDQLSFVSAAMNFEPSAGNGGAGQDIVIIDAEVHIVRGRCCTGLPCKVGPCGQVYSSVPGIWFAGFEADKRRFDIVAFVESYTAHPEITGRESELECRAGGSHIWCTN